MLEQAKDTALSAEPSTRDIPFLRIPKNSVYTCALTFGLGNLTSGAVDSPYVFQFNLSLVPGYGSYQTAFDSWRIGNVMVEFTPVVSTSGTSPIFSVIDYNDLTPLAITDAYQYDTLKIAPSGVRFNRVLQPRPAQAVYSGSAFTSYSQAVPKIWVDSSNPGVPWYGLKVIVSASSTPGLVALAYATCNFQFKNTR
jgi:hypothetical protein